MSTMDAIVASVAAFLCVSSAVCLIWALAAQRFQPTRRRLLASVSPTGVAAAGGGSRLTATLGRWVEVTLNVLLRLLRVKPHERGPGIVTVRHKVFLTCLLASTVAAIAPAVLRSLSGMPAPVAWIGAAGLSWVAMRLVTRWWIHWHVRRQLEAIKNGLSDVLDLWVLCLGAGMSFQSALVRVGSDADLTPPALREQLQLTHQEMLAGCPREEALRHLATRCGASTDMKALVSNIIQSERLGSSLSQTLRVYADALRFKRHQDTKELIQKLPVKLAFPLVFCILPALFVIILGPSLLRMYSALTSQ